MSKKKKNKKSNLSSLKLLESNTSQSISGEETLNSQPNNKTGWRAYLKNHYWMIGLILLLSLGVFGAGLKYLEEDAKRQIANGKLATGNQDQSFLNRINPFLSAPSLPTPTPQLSKEYLYAGSKLLAAEDANANVALPADLAIWRPSTGTWWVSGQGSQQITQQWGLNGDIPVPGDYEGDGKTDFSIFRPSTSTWWVLRSSDNGYFSNQFGQSGDKAAQADFDGDGKTDVAVFRPDAVAQTGTWYIQRTSDGGYTILQFGLNTDEPAAADYDGDGRADIGVWRASQRAFYSVNSNNNALQTSTFGQTQTGDKVVSADFDGDGKADYAVYNSATADWYIRQSTNGQITGYQWGTADDKPVQNDYDGDGKVDVAVWRGSNGNWYIRKSGSGGALRQEQWGMSGDIPVPAMWKR